MTWKFFLDGNQTINEPANWDGFEYVLSRSDNYVGVENVFSDTKLTFWAVDSYYLIQKFNQYGFDGSVDLKIQAICGDKVEDEINGVINMFTYSETEGQVSVVFEESAFSRKFKNRLDVKVNFSDLKSVDGGNLPDPDYFDLKLHSKEIIRAGKMYACNYPLETNFSTGGEYDFFDNPEYYVVPLFDQLVTDLDTLQLPTQPITHAVNTFLPILEQSPLFTSPFGGTYEFHIVIDADLVTTHHLRSFMKVAVGTGLNSGEIRLFEEFGFKIDTGSVDVSFLNNETFEFTLLPGEGLWFFFDTIWTGVLGDTALNYSLTVNSGFISIKDKQTKASPTDCRAIDIFNAFKRIVQNVTGQTDCFRSNFFGRSDIQPFSDTDGCGSCVAITNGLNIRNMLDKNGDKYPVSMTWNELYEAANSVWQLGWRIEFNNYGKAFVRVENAEYFYQNEMVDQFLEVAGISRDVAPEHLYNSIEIGYDKWNLNTGGLNGIDEFNTKHNYSLAVINPKNKLTQVCKFIAAGYVIELTRRKQYLKLSSKNQVCQSSSGSNDAGQNDFETDNNNFFICTNKQDILKSAIPTNTYSSTSSSKYKKGTISERNENFDIVDNLISPETAYNLRISPKRNLMRFYSLISVSLVGKVNPKIKFINGEGNFQEFDKYKTAAYDCDFSGTKEIHQGEDLEQSDLKDHIPLFKPIYISFETGLNFERFLNIRKHSNKAVQVSCNSSGLITGFIKDLRYIPNKDGGVGQFKILAAVCVNGSFDNGFDNGFDIGTC